MIGADLASQIIPDQVIRPEQDNTSFSSLQIGNFLVHEAVDNAAGALALGTKPHEVIRRTLNDYSERLAVGRYIFRPLSKFVIAAASFDPNRDPNRFIDLRAAYDFNETKHGLAKFETDSLAIDGFIERLDQYYADGNNAIPDLA
jgi:hypothetical protein